MNGLSDMIHDQIRLLFYALVTYVFLIVIKGVLFAYKRKDATKVIYYMWGFIFDSNRNLRSKILLFLINVLLFYLFFAIIFYI